MTDKTRPDEASTIALRHILRGVFLLVCLGGLVAVITQRERFHPAPPPPTPPKEIEAFDLPSRRARLAEKEAARKAALATAAEEARKEEEARKAAEERAARLALESAEETARREAEEARKKAEEEARRKAEEDARRAATQPPGPDTPITKSINDAYAVVFLNRKAFGLCLGQTYVRAWHSIVVPADTSSPKTARDDGKTPHGDYIVIHRESGPAGPVLTLNYPNLRDARRALQDGKIEDETFRRIQIAIRGKTMPPIGTPLGGPVQIRVNDGRPSSGDILLTKKQMDELYTASRIGMPVRIRNQ